MDDARFLIIGANGQLGLALGERFSGAQKADRAELDISNWESVQNYDWSKVDVILNGAAYTNVDGAETAEGRLSAWQVNATAVGYLSKIAAEHDITLIHLSTDYAFDGTQEPHTETEAFTPLGVYGQSKAAGDIAAATAPKHYIVRTSWVIGEGKNFVRTMMGLAAKNISPSVVGDQIGRPTFTKQLVDGIENLLKTQAAYGTYNLSNEGPAVSWADVTRTIFHELGRDDLIVTDTTTEEYFKNKPESAPRPLKSTLDLSKIKATGLEIRNWHDDLHHYILNEQKEQ
ncbi:MAG TPA: NAD(P)-dependent oxidoreductase [Candidatus Saccharimonadales bacterium]|nr:NAD(P)-dependent oxidoreductase [Candidatus Saccharimonadales bacterium]